MRTAELPQYVFRRGNILYVRLQPPGQKLVERSLGTSDPKAAELAAADLIKQHKALMYQRRQTRVASVVHGPWTHEYTPGLYTLPDGGHVMATDTTLTFTDAKGQLVGKPRPNGGPAIYLTGAQLPAAREFKAFDDAHSGAIGEGPIENGRPSLLQPKLLRMTRCLKLTSSTTALMVFASRRPAKCGEFSEPLSISRCATAHAKMAEPSWPI